MKKKVAKPEKLSKQPKGKGGATSGAAEARSAGADQYNAARSAGADQYNAARSAGADQCDPRYVMDRLDQSLPLITEDWKRVEQLLNLMTEFAPTDMVMELAGAIANYADDQAKRGYLLGQEDMVKEVRRLVA